MASSVRLPCGNFPGRRIEGERAGCQVVFCAQIMAWNVVLRCFIVVLRERFCNTHLLYPIPIENLHIRDWDFIAVLGWPAVGRAANDGRIIKFNLEYQQLHEVKRYWLQVIG